MNARNCSELMPIEAPKQREIDPVSFVLWTVYAALLVALAAWLLARYAELLGTAGGAAFGLRQPAGVRYEVFNFDADARVVVLFTARWRWVARVLVIWYELSSPGVAYWRVKP